MSNARVSLYRVVLRFEAGRKSLLVQIELLFRSGLLLLRGLSTLVFRLSACLLLCFSGRAAARGYTGRRADGRTFSGVVVRHLANGRARRRTARRALEPRAVLGSWLLRGLLCWGRCRRRRRCHGIDTGLSLGPGVALTFVLAL